MTTEFKWNESLIILWCSWSDSDAYIGCKLRESDYYKGWVSPKTQQPMQVKVMLKTKAGGYEVYAEGSEIYNIGKSNQYRLLPGGHGEGYYDDYIGLRDYGWKLENRYKRPLNELLWSSEPPKVLSYGTQK